jgi:mycofactocin radical SAM maturase
MDYLDIQISLDGIDAATNDAVRGAGSYDMARRAMDNLAAAGFVERNGPFKISIVVTRHNVDQLDEFKALADSYGAQLRVTRLRPSGRGADTWHDLHPTNAQQRQIYHWLLANGDNVLTGDSFFHLNALGEALPGLNMCGAGRVVCLIDPIGDVYACPFVIHDQFKAGSVRDEGGFAHVWKHSELFRELREPQSAGACASCGSYDACQGGCMAAKFFTGLPLDGPDPECVGGAADDALQSVDTGVVPKPSMDHSKPVRLTRKPVPVPVAGA